MIQIKAHSYDMITPSRDAVFKTQGIPPDTVVHDEIETLYTKALALLSVLAAPFSIVSEVSEFDSDVVYYGEGRNESRTPIGDIFKRADHLALFAVTIGQPISREIQDRFQSNDFALASMLDSVASAAVDRLAANAERFFFKALSEEGYPVTGTVVLGYSPGYCGWHISGQRRLFDILRPQQIGISLNDSFLMQPMKSVSGVLVAGPKEIHTFPTSYPSCSQCETRGCRERIRTLMAG